MIRRCGDKGAKCWKDYGGRGIKVYPEWRDFSAFYAHLQTLLPVGETDIPKGLFIDRKDNDGDYEPGNVRLATRSENNRNTRRNVFVTIGGETRVLVEWCQIKGIAYGTVWCRRKSGMTYEEALTKPLRQTTFLIEPRGNP